MKKNIFRVAWIINILVHIIIFIMFNTVLKNNYDTSSINYVSLIIIEVLNIVFGALLFSKIDKDILFVLFVIFIVSTIFIPVYHTARTYAPSGPKSELMGLAIEEKDLNIYSIDTIIKW